MPKDHAATANGRQARRHNPLPLHEELLAHDSVRTKPSRQKRRDATDGRAQFVDAGLSKKILQIAKEQQDEIDQEASANGTASIKRRSLGSSRGGSSDQNGLGALRFSQIRDDDDDEDEDDDDEEYNGLGGDEEEEYEEVEEVVWYTPIYFLTQNIRRSSRTHCFTPPR